MGAKKTPAMPERWWLLVHQLPPKPDYFRVKIGRRLQALGAVAVKNSVYVLPYSDQTQEDLQWLLGEIRDGGGEVVLCEARFADGISDADVRTRFRTARDEDYREIARAADSILDDAKSVRPKSGDSLDEGAAARLRGEAARLEKRIGDVRAIDFFGAESRVAA